MATFSRSRPRRPAGSDGRRRLTAGPVSLLCHDWLLSAPGMLNINHMAVAPWRSVSTTTARSRRLRGRADRQRRRRQVDLDERSSSASWNPTRAKSKCRTASATSGTRRTRPAALRHQFDTCTTDTERAELLAEAERAATAPARRLAIVRAIVAPPTRVLGLGFDKFAVQVQPLRAGMRVALAALLFQARRAAAGRALDHLDFEATWFEFPQDVRWDADRDQPRSLLNNVVDAVATCDTARSQLFIGNSDRVREAARRARRANRVTQASQNAQRAGLRDYIAHNGTPAPRPPNRPGRRSGICWPGCRNRSPRWTNGHFPVSERTSAAADHPRHGRGWLCRRNTVLAEIKSLSIRTIASRCSAARVWQDDARPPAPPRRHDGHRHLRAR